MNTLFNYDNALERYVFENIGSKSLEMMIEERQENFHSLKNKNLDFGKPVKPEEVQALFEKVRDDVEEVTHFKGIYNPSIEYLKRSKTDGMDLIFYAISGFSAALSAVTFASGELPIAHGILLAATSGIMIYSTEIKRRNFIPTYSSIGMKIRMHHSPETNLAATIAHEYAHHLQNEAIGIFKWFRIFTEGHARTVEKRISAKYAAETGNEAYLYSALGSDLVCLQAAYLWFCKEMKKKPHPCSIKGFKRWHKKHIRHEHAVGTAVFRHAEKIGLNGICRLD